MRTASLYEHYELYVREYRSVLQLIDRGLKVRGSDPATAVRARRELLGRDALAAFIYVTERMQAEVSDGKLEVDVVLAALVYECCDKLTLANEENGEADGQGNGQDQRRRQVISPAGRLFHGACQRLLKQGVTPM